MFKSDRLLGCLSFLAAVRKIQKLRQPCNIATFVHPRRMELLYKISIWLLKIYHAKVKKIANNYARGLLFFSILVLKKTILDYATITQIYAQKGRYLAALSPTKLGSGLKHLWQSKISCIEPTRFPVIEPYRFV